MLAAGLAASSRAPPACSLASRIRVSDGRTESSVCVHRFLSSVDYVRLDGGTRAFLAVMPPVCSAVLAQGKRRRPRCAEAINPPGVDSSLYCSPVMYIVTKNKAVRVNAAEARRPRGERG